ncbi:carboxymuconolactone decarboxylase family protein [Pseudomonas frederiksbergensis]|uniref:carboxymuconolactone decarboxylase family protein n=1 Tax=Pseudomonas frederiksbergensis TaxID=104087 RepID=UPI00197E5276|nr:carboxymuconolactone decarboxylase family protein [Pseudomonas frederiksbergensis]MBN3864903.1 carboxymuconolactone decarboxylase family protein [Pseudomonas frederiksbergensis]
MSNGSRLPVLPEADLNEKQKQILQEILQGPRGNLDGPFLAWIHSPELANRAQHLGAFCRYDTQLPTRLTELAILTTAAWWRSQAEWQIHEPIARENGISSDVIDAILAGTPPPFVEPDEELVYRFTQRLYSTRRVDAALYRDVEMRFGTAGVVELTGLLGYYALVAMTLNVFNIHLDHNYDKRPFEEIVDTN